MGHQHLVALALTCSAVAGCASGSPGERFGRDGDRIIDGAPHSGDPAVVYLVMDGSFGCTGSLIAPQVVLTARHCIENESGVLAASSVQIGVGEDAATGTIYAGVTRIETTMGGGIEQQDIALLVLDRAGDLTPYEWARTPPVAGDAIVGIGYGQTEGSAPGSSSGGTKYRGESTVGSFDARELTTSGALSCYGDSGGPGFIDGVVAGIVSRGTADTCEGGSTIYTRVDAFAAMIEGVLASVGTDPGAPPGGDPGTDPGSPGTDPGCVPPADWDPAWGDYCAEDAPPADPGTDPGCVPPADWDPAWGDYCAEEAPDTGAPPPGAADDFDGDGCPDEVDLFPGSYEDYPWTYWGEPCFA